jgi:cardiolipin synthase (CMP-forming)
MNSNINIPNILSGLRLLSVPVMILLTFLGRDDIFKWVLLGALASDILDGFIARTFRMVTKLGSILDAMADTAMYVVVVLAIGVLRFDFVLQQWVPLAVVVGLYLAEKVKCFFKYGKLFNSFHNYLAKAMGYAQGLFVLTLFFFGYQWFFFYPAIGIGILANIEDMVLSSLLPTYEQDTKGLYWVLKRKKEAKVP